MYTPSDYSTNSIANERCMGLKFLLYKLDSIDRASIYIRGCSLKYITWGLKLAIQNTKFNN